MQHRYVGDVGDFGKYALLNALSRSGLRLGVIWYLNERVENNADGKFIAFNHLENLSPELFQKLKIIRGQARDLEQVEASTILPHDTVFARHAVPFPERPCYSEARRILQQQLRRDWFASVLRGITDSQLVFLDPDNGIATPSLKLHSTKACKYVLQEEVETLLNSGRSVVVYQHQHRNGTLEQQVERAVQRFSHCSADAFAITFHAFAVRAYLIIPANQAHASILHSSARQFLNKWSSVFRPAFGNSH